ncbi:hypothetical protein HK099_008695 [Clydaea vesicula]|uniref:SH3 domain-containing protein n=1 Tax=Clydaea vesicula TaxID=447962 RepID=A0AAD5Y2B7_9FUNG|nr:hypothetical protein HK099_008695 [Clydaea vesicula]
MLLTVLTSAQFFDPKNLTSSLPSPRRPFRRLRFNIKNTNNYTVSLFFKNRQNSFTYSSDVNPNSELLQQRSRDRYSWVAVNKQNLNAIFTFTTVSGVLNYTIPLVESESKKENPGTIKENSNQLRESSTEQIGIHSKLKSFPFILIYILSIIIFLLIGILIYFNCRNLRKPKKKEMILVPVLELKNEKSSFHTNSTAPLLHDELSSDAGTNNSDSTVTSDINTIKKFFFPNYHGIMNYTPLADDEIEVKKNDEICVTAIYNDGWVEGENLRTGKAGTLPFNVLSRKHLLEHKSSSSSLTSDNEVMFTSSQERNFVVLSEDSIKNRNNPTSKLVRCESLTLSYRNKLKGVFGILGFRNDESVSFFSFRQMCFSNCV